MPSRPPKITLYTEKDFKGCCKDFCDPQYSLCFTGFNNRVSSVEVHSGLWVLYQHCFLGGKIYVVWEGQKINLPCEADDTISSLKPIEFDFTVSPSCTLYEDKCFGGRKQVFEGVTRYPDLGKFCFNDKVSSVAVQSGGWIGFQHCCFKGKQYLFLTGRHNGSASEGCFEHDAISSWAPIILGPHPSAV
ncbi:beta-crystallin B2-like [Mizuhopecten yessoensis]|uniref:Beta-crystallin B2 n=1 Tax=Mizuhopecten yessoensis TaxID=6573 RepID=A0A210PJL8_MIZYE|nr:beta-crystallin B2-like [Mizuhopecten yessoensis]OWF36688.1 Beta-crystallin B2 [Mizuhopecten yessoensis]